MSLLSRLFPNRHDERAALRPLWDRIVTIGRERTWYAELGIADTVAGRFDAITLVLALVLLRMEKEPALIEPSVRLTEIFVDDMDGQLRQSGVGDLVVGKHVGRLMGVLGGRLGSLREALPLGEEALAEVIARNVTMTEQGDAARIATESLTLSRKLERVSAGELLAGHFAR